MNPNDNAKTILVTGATSGIGKAAAMILAAQGHRLLLHARDAGKAESLRADLAAQTGNPSLQCCQADFADFDQVRQLGTRLRNDLGRLDVLINNAGTWEMQFAESSQQVERNFCTNHLAPMLLTLELLPLLQRSGNARIVNTSSGAHRRNILDLDDPEWRHKPYDGVATYSQSKLCNLLFSLRLSRLLAGTAVTVNTVHPGYVRTSLFDKMGQRDWQGVPDAAEGARGTVFAAIDPAVEGLSGRYFYRESEDPNLSPLAKDAALADALWQVSMRYIGPYLSDGAARFTDQKINTL